MTWIQLINNEINSLEKEKINTQKKLDKIREDDSPKNFEKKVSLMVDIKSIQESINTLYVILGKANQVNE